MMVRGLAFLAMLLWGASSAAAAAAPREPTGKWKVDFDDAQCVASRNYGSTEEPLHLVLKAPPLGEVMQIAVMRNGGYAPPDQVNATIAIDDQAALKTNLLMFGPKDSKKRVYTLNLPSADFARIRGAKSLTIRSLGLNETFAVSQIEPLLKVMDQCVADLRRVWNLSSDGATSTLANRATGNPGDWVKSEDYPGVAIMKGASGVVRFVILIDEMGRAADCTVVETSGVAVLDAQSCAVLKQRAKFKPAIGPDGKPAKDAYTARFRWVMP
jgi:TonB family protein